MVPSSVPVVSYVMSLGIYEGKEKCELEQVKCVIDLCRQYSVPTVVREVFSVVDTTSSFVLPQELQVAGYVYLSSSKLLGSSMGGVQVC